MTKLGRPKGHIFACSNKTQTECFDRMLFATNKVYAPKMMRVKKGDILFLLNVDSDTLYGTFKAKSDGALNISPDAWHGKFPYQVRVATVGKVSGIKKAKSTLAKLAIRWKESLDGEQAVLISDYVKKPTKANLSHVQTKLSKVVTRNAELEAKPILESTTLWNYNHPKDDNLPSAEKDTRDAILRYIAYNLIQRYTDPNDIVLDPMAGNGIMIDTCKSEDRRCIAYDLFPSRQDIARNDARKIPLEENCADMIFVNPPSGIGSNKPPSHLGGFSANSIEFYNELEKVMKECYRVVKPNKVVAWLMEDQLDKDGRFVATGYKIYIRLLQHFSTDDIICIAKNNSIGSSEGPVKADDLYSRGFMYLFILRKTLPTPNSKTSTPATVKWQQYPRQ